MSPAPMEVQYSPERTNAEYNINVAQYSQVNYFQGGVSDDDDELAKHNDDDDGADVDPDQASLTQPKALLSSTNLGPIPPSASQSRKKRSKGIKSRNREAATLMPPPNPEDTADPRQPDEKPIKVKEADVPDSRPSAQSKSKKHQQAARKGSKAKDSRNTEVDSVPSQDPNPLTPKAKEQTLPPQSKKKGKKGKKGQDTWNTEEGDEVNEENSPHPSPEPAAVPGLNQDDEVSKQVTEPLNSSPSPETLNSSPTPEAAVSAPQDSAPDPATNCVETTPESNQPPQPEDLASAEISATEPINDSAAAESQESVPQNGSDLPTGAEAEKAGIAEGSTTSENPTAEAIATKAVDEDNPAPIDSLDGHSSSPSPGDTEPAREEVVLVETENPERTLPTADAQESGTVDPEVVASADHIPEETTEEPASAPAEPMEVEEEGRCPPHQIQISATPDRTGEAQIPTEAEETEDQPEQEAVPTKIECADTPALDKAAAGDVALEIDSSIQAKDIPPPHQPDDDQTDHAQTDDSQPNDPQLNEGESPATPVISSTPDGNSVGAIEDAPESDREAAGVVADEVTDDAANDAEADADVAAERPPSLDQAPPEGTEATPMLEADLSEGTSDTPVSNEGFVPEINTTIDSHDVKLEHSTEQSEPSAQATVGLETIESDELVSETAITSNGSELPVEPDVSSQAQEPSEPSESAVTQEEAGNSQSDSDVPVVDESIARDSPAGMVEPDYPVSDSSNRGETEDEYALDVAESWETEPTDIDDKPTQAEDPLPSQERSDRSSISSTMDILPGDDVKEFSEPLGDTEKPIVASAIETKHSGVDEDSDDTGIAATNIEAVDKSEEVPAFKKQDHSTKDSEAVIDSGSTTEHLISDPECHVDADRPPVDYTANVGGDPPDDQETTEEASSIKNLPSIETLTQTGGPVPTEETAEFEGQAATETLAIAKHPRDCEILRATEEPNHLQAESDALAETQAPSDPPTVQDDQLITLTEHSASPVDSPETIWPTDSVSGDAGSTQATEVTNHSTAGGLGIEIAEVKEKDESKDHTAPQDSGSSGSDDHENTTDDPSVQAASDEGVISAEGITRDMTNLDDLEMSLQHPAPTESMAAEDILSESLDHDEFISAPPVTATEDASLSENEGADVKAIPAETTDPHHSNKDVTDSVPVHSEDTVNANPLGEADADGVTASESITADSTIGGERVVNPMEVVPSKERTMDSPDAAADLEIGAGGTSVDTAGILGSNVDTHEERQSEASDAEEMALDGEHGENRAHATEPGADATRSQEGLESDGTAKARAVEVSDEAPSDNSDFVEKSFQDGWKEGPGTPVPSTESESKSSSQEQDLEVDSSVLTDDPLGLDLASVERAAAPEGTDESAANGSLSAGAEAILEEAGDVVSPDSAESDQNVTMETGSGKHIPEPPSPQVLNPDDTNNDVDESSTRHMVDLTPSPIPQSKVTVVDSDIGASSIPHTVLPDDEEKPVGDSQGISGHDPDVGSQGGLDDASGCKLEEEASQEMNGSITGQSSNDSPTSTEESRSGPNTSGITGEDSADKSCQALAVVENSIPVSGRNHGMETTNEGPAPPGDSSLDQQEQNGENSAPLTMNETNAQNERIADEVTQSMGPSDQSSESEKIDVNDTPSLTSDSTADTKLVATHQIDTYIVQDPVDTAAVHKHTPELMGAETKLDVQERVGPDVDATATEPPHEITGAALILAVVADEPMITKDNGSVGIAEIADPSPGKSDETLMPTPFAASKDAEQRARTPKCQEPERVSEQAEDSKGATGMTDIQGVADGHSATAMVPPDVSMDVTPKKRERDMRRDICLDDKAYKSGVTMPQEKNLKSSRQSHQSSSSRPIHPRNDEGRDNQHQSQSHGLDTDSSYHRRRDSVRSEHSIPKDGRFQTPRKEDVTGLEGGAPKSPRRRRTIEEQDEHDRRKADYQARDRDREQGNERDRDRDRTKYDRDLDQGRNLDRRRDRVGDRVLGSARNGEFARQHDGGKGQERDRDRGRDSRDGNRVHDPPVERYGQLEKPGDRDRDRDRDRNRGRDSERNRDDGREVDKDRVRVPDMAQEQDRDRKGDKARERRRESFTDPPEQERQREPNSIRDRDRNLDKGREYPRRDSGGTRDRRERDREEDDRRDAVRNQTRDRERVGRRNPRDAARERSETLDSKEKKRRHSDTRSYESPPRVEKGDSPPGSRERDQSRNLVGGGRSIDKSAERDEGRNLRSYARRYSLSADNRSDHKMAEEDKESLMMMTRRLLGIRPPESGLGKNAAQHVPSFYESVGGPAPRFEGVLRSNTARSSRLSRDQRSEEAPRERPHRRESMDSGGGGRSDRSDTRRNRLPMMPQQDAHPRDTRDVQETNTDGGDFRGNVEGEAVACDHHDNDKGDDAENVATASAIPAASSAAAPKTDEDAVRRARQELLRRARQEKGRAGRNLEPDDDREPRKKHVGFNVGFRATLKRLLFSPS